MLEPPLSGSLLRETGIGFTVDGSESGPPAIINSLLSNLSAQDLNWSTNDALSPGVVNGGNALGQGSQPPPLRTGSPFEVLGPVATPDESPSPVAGRLGVAGAPVNDTIIRLAAGANSVFGLSSGVSPPVAVAGPARVVAPTLVNAVAGTSGNSCAARASAEVGVRAIAEVLPFALGPARDGTALAFMPAKTATAMGTSTVPVIDNLAGSSDAKETMPLLAGLLQPAVTLDKFKDIFALPQLPSRAAELNWTDWAMRLLRSPYFAATMVAVGGLELLRRCSRRSAAKSRQFIDVPEVTGPVGL
jgi:hypothetical protein